MRVVSKVTVLLVLTGSLIVGTAGSASADPITLPPPVPSVIAHTVGFVVTLVLGPGVCC